VIQVVSASPDYLRRRGVPRSPADLAEHDVLQFTPLGWGDEWRLSGPRARDERRIPVRTRFASDSGEALLAAACAGAGLALLPDWLIYRELASGALVRVPPGWARGNVPIHAVHASAARAPAKVRLCVEALVRHFGRRPYWAL
jgi:DNA-binding transcriptional LysR family regulator